MQRAAAAPVPGRCTFPLVPSQRWPDETPPAADRMQLSNVVGEKNDQGSHTYCCTSAVLSL